MKIVVLAGGISTERTVSLVSGTGVCQALRRKGHQAILVDMFMGLENPPADLNTLFDAPDGLCPDVKIEVQAPDLDVVRRSRLDQSPSRIGPHVLDICRLADIVFLGLHGQDGEDGRRRCVTRCAMEAGDGLTVTIAPPDGDAALIPGPSMVDWAEKTASLLT